jgi:hypothetical protein
MRPGKLPESDVGSLCQKEQNGKIGTSRTRTSSALDHVDESLSILEGPLGISLQ